MFKNLSLSFKIVLLFIITAIAMVLVLRFASGESFVQQFQKTMRPHLYQYFKYVNTEIGNPPNLETAKRLSEELKIKILIRGPDLRWASDGEFLTRNSLQFRENNKRDKRYESGRYKRQLVIRIQNRPYRTTFITKSDSNLPSPWVFLLNTFLGILLVLGILYFFLRKMISPLKDIQESVKRIGSGDLEHRINVKKNDELGKLSNEINSMADDIQNMLEAKRQLLLAISHELRSPITRAKVAISLMDDSNSKIKEGLEEDLNEMQTMVGGLLEAEQLNDRHQVLNKSNANINNVVNHVLATHFSEEAIEHHLGNNISDQLFDESRLQFVIKNLLGNALKYRKESTDPISITTKQNKNVWTIEVKDQGIGIPDSHIPHLTEPFYRVDPSRNRGTGGYGLGLYIIQMIVEAHQGELKIQSKEGVGTTVTISIPVTQ